MAQNQYQNHDWTPESLFHFCLTFGPSKCQEGRQTGNYIIYLDISLSGIFILFQKEKIV